MTTADNEQHDPFPSRRELAERAARLETHHSRRLAALEAQRTHPTPHPDPRCPATCPDDANAWLRHLTSEGGDRG